MKASKNFYGKKEKDIRWVIITIKSFFHLSHQRWGHPTKKKPPMIPSLIKWGWQWQHQPMCKCYQPTKQCWPTDEKTKKKVAREHGFAPTKHENWHLSQWAQKHLERHHVIESFPHCVHNKKNRIPMGSNKWS